MIQPGIGSFKVHGADCHRDNSPALQPFLPVLDLIMNDCVKLLPLMIVTVTAEGECKCFLKIRAAHRQTDKRHLHGNSAVKAVQQLCKLPERDSPFLIGQHRVIDVRHQIAFAVKADCFMPDLDVLRVQHHMTGHKADIRQGLRRGTLSAEQPFQKSKYMNHVPASLYSPFRILCRTTSSAMSAS